MVRANAMRSVKTGIFSEVALLVLLAISSLRTRAADVALEYKVKAGYIYNFAKFVQWPEKRVSAPGEPIVVSILDRGEALGAIEQVLNGKSVEGHPIHVRGASSPEEALESHVLFVTRAAGKSPREILQVLGKAPVLLVGETEKFAEQGGTVGFIREEENIRVALNLDAAMAAGLSVSSKLASVARVVKGGLSR
jgi:hypothetical protein